MFVKFVVKECGHFCASGNVEAETSQHEREALAITHVHLARHREK